MVAQSTDLKPVAAIPNIGGRFASNSEVFGVHVRGSIEAAKANLELRVERATDRIKMLRWRPPSSEPRNGDRRRPHCALSVDGRCLR
jgi:hypothetical protein